MKLGELIRSGRNEPPALDDMAENAYQATELLKALANVSRLMILCKLVEGEKSVAELNKLTNRAQSSVSQELARLRRQDLVSSRRDGKTVYYSIKSEAAKRIISALYDIYCSSEC